jgi:retron-type reverse transcriptase
MIESGNMNAAWKQVKGNRGAAGVDGLDIAQSAERIRREWDKIKAQLSGGIYRPQPARRVEIPKANGGIRKLGVPTVQDRLIQQAALQVLSPLFEPDFSSHSYGFRPGRSAHQAVLAAQRYQEAGKRWVVDLDLASFLDACSQYTSRFFYVVKRSGTLAGILILRPLRRPRWTRTA